MLCGVLVGCSHPTGPVRPVSWYLSHEIERQSEVAWCLDDAGRERAVNCANATEAQRRTQLGSQRTLAPIAWSAAPSSP